MHALVPATGGRQWVGILWCCAPPGPTQPQAHLSLTPASIHGLHAVPLLARLSSKSRAQRCGRSGMPEEALSAALLLTCCAVAHVCGGHAVLARACAISICKDTLCLRVLAQSPYARTRCACVCLHASPSVLSISTHPHRCFQSPRIPIHGHERVALLLAYAGNAMQVEQGQVPAPQGEASLCCCR